MFSFFCLVILSLFLVNEINGCTHSQRYWNQLNVSDWPLNGELCQVSWKEIIGIDTMRMVIPGNQYWVVAAHQYITARLNERVDTNNNVTVDETTRGALLWLGDSLDRACLNLSSWSATSSVPYRMIEQLRSYNEVNQCDEGLNYNMSDTGCALYYMHTADLLVIPANLSLQSNKTLSYSLLSDEYRFRQFTMSGAVVGCLVGIPVLTIIIIILLDRRRKYHLSKKRVKVPAQVTIGTRRSSTNGYERT